MKKMNKNKSHKTINTVAIIEIAFASFICFFWILFFSTDLFIMNDSHQQEIYFAFESSFPVADLYLCITLVVGGIGLLRKALFGYIISLLGGSSLIFLGLLDTSFNTQQGIYLVGIEEAVLNVFINLSCLVVGTFIIFSIWKKSKNCVIRDQTIRIP